jgi:hypothetical protein
VSGIFRTTDGANGDLEQLAEYRHALTQFYPTLPNSVEQHMSIHGTDALALARFFDQFPHETKVFEIGTFVGVSAFHSAGRSKVSEVLTVDTNPSLAELSAEWGEDWGTHGSRT